MKYTYLTTSLLAGVFCLASCSTTETAPHKPMSATIGTTKSTNEAGEEITCNRQYATGSRVKFTEVCGTAAEWSEIEDANQRALRDMTESAAANSK